MEQIQIIEPEPEGDYGMAQRRDRRGYIDALRFNLRKIDLDLIQLEKSTIKDGSLLKMLKEDIRDIDTILVLRRIS